jgi:hypothetical protein
MRATQAYRPLEMITAAPPRSPGNRRAVIGALVTHVLVHEIGHHFGLSDADMEAIEAAADG